MAASGANVQADNGGTDAMIAAARGYFADLLDLNLRDAGAERFATAAGLGRFGRVVAGTERSLCVTRKIK
jgi:hypothetical protein